MEKEPFVKYSTVAPDTYLGIIIMKKITVFLTALLVLSGIANAQISQGDPFSTNIRTGNRPQAGHWGIFLGPSYTELRDFINWVDKNGNIDVVRGLPLLNFKYYNSDQVEVRLGLQYYSRTFRSSGTLDVTGDKMTHHDAESFLRLTPGLAYHFSNKNLLDVYGGAYIPVGHESYTDNSKVGTYEAGLSRSSFIIGLGCFVGVQTFVADLPFSIGLEYGIDGVFHTGLRDKVVYTDGSGNKQTVYTEYGNGDNPYLGASDIYKKYSASKNDIGTNLRLTLTYYFTNK